MSRHPVRAPLVCVGELIVATTVTHPKAVAQMLS